MAESCACAMEQMGMKLPGWCLEASLPFREQYIRSMAESCACAMAQWRSREQFFQANLAWLFQ
jgi:hypothetical protein